MCTSLICPQVSHPSEAAVQECGASSPSGLAQHPLEERYLTARNAGSDGTHPVITIDQLLCNTPHPTQEEVHTPILPDTSLTIDCNSLESYRTPCNTSHDRSPLCSPPVHHRLDPGPPGAKDTRSHQSVQPCSSQIGPNGLQPIPALTSYSTSSWDVYQSGIPSTNPMMSPHAFSRASRVPPSEHTIIARQQPTTARACGFGERDRRAIDPPPILELRNTGKGTSSLMSDNNSMFAMHCTIVDPSSLRDQTRVRPVCVEMQSTLRLAGTLVASPYQAIDEHGDAGTFFVFPDLSCRTPGRYRLCFRLLQIDMHNTRQGAVHSFVASIVTDVFEVYIAREFPGMKPSSALLKVLRQQGMNVSVKRGSKAQEGKCKPRENGGSPEPDGGSVVADEQHCSGQWADKHAQDDQQAITASRKLKRKFLLNE